MGDGDSLGRGSLDSSFSVPRQQQRPRPEWPPQGDDSFEEVKLGEEPRPAAPPAASRRRGLFAKFGGSASAPLAPPASPPPPPQGVAPPHHAFPLFSARRLGQGALGAEMATIPQDRELGAVDGDAAVVDAVTVQ
jgi:hypothetical protein